MLRNSTDTNILWHLWETILKCKNCKVPKELQSENKQLYSVKEMQEEVELQEIKPTWYLKTDLTFYSWSSCGSFTN